MVAYGCHGKTKNLMAKPNTSRQNQIPSQQKQKFHGKIKYLTAKPHGKTKVRGGGEGII